MLIEVQKYCQDLLAILSTIMLLHIKVDLVILIPPVVITSMVSKVVYCLNTETKLKFLVVHFDDMLYSFWNSLQFPRFNRSDPEAKTVKKWTTLWYNFAKYRYV